MIDLQNATSEEMADEMRRIYSDANYEQQSAICAVDIISHIDNLLGESATIEIVACVMLMHHMHNHVATSGDEELKSIFEYCYFHFSRSPRLEQNKDNKYLKAAVLVAGDCNFPLPENLEIT